MWVMGRPWIQQHVCARNESKKGRLMDSQEESQSGLISSPRCWDKRTRTEKLLLIINYYKVYISEVIVELEESVCFANAWHR